VDERGLARVRAQLEGFAAVVFAGLPRSDQRATGLRYLRGLMLDGRRKSMQPMAERLGVDHQQLQQFLTSSTWDVAGLRRRLATAAIELVDPQVWVVDDTGFPKDGKASACVARQYTGTLGKVANCQIAVSVHAAASAASAVLDWRLFVPESWDETCVPDDEGNLTNPHAHRLRQSRQSAYTLDEAGAKKPHVRSQLPGQEQVALIRDRRAAARLPDTERYRPKWLMALEMLDELGGWGLRPPLLTADAGYGQVAEFRLGLTERGIGYVVATTSSTTAQPGDAAPVPVPYPGVGKYPQPKYPDPARTVKDLALRHVSSGADTAHLVRWRHRLPGSLATTGDPDRPADELAGHFFALRIRPAGRAIQRSTHRGPDRVLPECWLLVEWPPTADEPSDYWLSDLPPDTPLAELVRLAKSRWRIEHDYRELKQALGLDHFEGRSWIGWHRHVTLAAAAQLFLTQLRLQNPKAQGQD
jgi:SRSO17 transposase